MLDTLWSEKFISALAQVSYKGQIGSDEQYKGKIKPSCLYKHSTINKTSDFIFTKRLNFKFMFWSKDWMSAWYFSENKKFYIMYILLLTINNIIVLICVIKTQDNELWLLWIPPDVMMFGKKKEVCHQTTSYIQLFLSTTSDTITMYFVLASNYLFSY